MKLFFVFCIVLLLSLSSCTSLNGDATLAPSQNLVSVSVEEFQSLQQSRDDVILLDVRTAEEYHQEHIEGAMQLDFYASDFRQQLDVLDKDQTYLIHCRSGSRSGKTLQLMGELGFTSVYNLESGIVGWKQHDFPTCMKNISSYDNSRC